MCTYPVGLMEPLEHFFDVCKSYTTQNIYIKMTFAYI